jgi:hypothetical protein
MNRRFAGFFAVALVAGLAVPAQSQVRAFEPPPTLVPANPPAAGKMKTMLFSSRISGPADCE